MINVYDDFFSEEIREEIWNLLGRNKWGCGGGIKNGSLGNWFWHMENLEDESYFNDYLYNLISDKLGKKYQIGRIYANGQSAGQSGYPHIDGGDVTFLYYPNPDWKLNWNGHLIFSEDGEEPTKIIGYKPNRAVLFSSNIMNYADAPHSYFPGFRISLAYKFIEPYGSKHMKLEFENKFGIEIGSKNLDIGSKK